MVKRNSALFSSKKPRKKKVIDFKVNEQQLNVLKSQKFITALLGGVGCGKTHIGSIWTLKKIQTMNRGQLGLIAANSYSQLKDSTLRSLYRNCAEWGVQIRPPTIPKGNQPITIELLGGNGWIEILCRSLENYEQLAGVEIHFAWSDETYQTPTAALDLIVDRLRDERNHHPAQFLLTTTVDDPGSALYDFLVENHNPELMDVFTATTYDNLTNLPVGYIDRLKAIHTSRNFDRMVLSKWVNLEGANIYHSFDRSLHITDEAEFNPKLNLAWTHDFNIGEGKPISSLLGHIIPNPGGNPEVHFFDEIVIESADTNDVIREFESRDYKSRSKASTIIYGDASGKSKDTRSKSTDYQLFREAGFPNQRVPLKNPPIRTRHNTVNTMLKNADGVVRVKINPRCKTFIKGLETGRLKKGAGYIEHEDYHQHVVTAAGYFLTQEFSVDRQMVEVRKLYGG